jgi:hypothetical protein
MLLSAQHNGQSVERADSAHLQMIQMLCKPTGDSSIEHGATHDFADLDSAECRDVGRRFLRATATSAQTAELQMQDV